MKCEARNRAEHKSSKKLKAHPMKCEARNRAEHRTSKKLNERNLTMKKIKGGVTAPKGFAAMGLNVLPQEHLQQIR